MALGRNQSTTKLNLFFFSFLVAQLLFNLDLPVYLSITKLKEKIDLSASIRDRFLKSPLKINIRSTTHFILFVCFAAIDIKIQK